MLSNAIATVISTEIYIPVFYKLRLSTTFEVGYYLWWASYFVKVTKLQLQLLF